MQQSLLRRKKKLLLLKKRSLRTLKFLSRHHFALPIATFCSLLLVSVGGYFAFFHGQEKHTLNNDAHLVIISYDKQQRVVPAVPQTVGELLHKLSIPINPGDAVEPELTTKIVQDNFRINIYRAVPVQIVGDDGTSKFSFSAATTPRSIAAQAGVQLYAEDAVESRPVTNFLKQGSVGEQIVFKRSQPVNLNLYGTAAPTRTLAKTVGGMLQEKHIKLINGASVNPAPDTPLTPGLQVFVLAKGVSIASQEEVVPAPVQNVDDNNLTLGSRAVRQRGSPGKQLVTYQIKTDPATGQEVGRTVIQSVVTQDPVPEIVAIGKNVNIPKDKLSIMAGAGIRSSDYGYVDYIVSHEGGWAGTTRYNTSGSGAYGICQALPGSKMASAGADWRTNPVTQLKWCSGYATGRYGSWSGAYNYWVSHHYW